MNPSDRLKKLDGSSNGPQYKLNSNYQLNTKQTHKTNSNGTLPNDAEASKMLEAALLQMDGIIMGETYLYYYHLFSFVAVIVNILFINDGLCEQEF